MATEREENTPLLFLPQVSWETISDLDNRFEPFKEENQNIAETENHTLFLHLLEKKFSLIGAYLIYIPLKREATKRGTKLPYVSQNTIDSYFQNPFWKEVDRINLPITEEDINKLEEAAKQTESILPTSKMPQENPHLASFLEWWCDLFKEEGLDPPKINEVQASAHLTYELLSKQAENDLFQASFNF